MATKLIFWDRDGIINVGRPPAAEETTEEEKRQMYILSEEDFELVPGIKEVLAEFKEKYPDLYHILITKQRCVERGYITVEGLKKIHQKMEELLEFKFDDMEVQTHKIEGGSKDALMTAAMQKFDVEASECAAIGDRASDLKLAEDVGIPIRILITWQSERDGLTDDIEQARNHATHIVSTPEKAIRELNLLNEDGEIRLKEKLTD